jgi:hypothetical protein
MVFFSPRQPIGQRRKRTGLWAVQAISAALLAINVGVALGVVPALQGVILLGATVVIYTGPFVSWPKPGDLGHLGRKVVRSSGVWIGLATSTAVAAAWVATPPIDFPRAAISTSTHSSTTAGYVGRNGDGLFIATCSPATSASDNGDGHAMRVSDGSVITFVKDDDVRGLSLGGDDYRFDVEPRPSVAQIALGAVGVSNPLTDTALLDHALRGRATEVCGG